MIKLFNKVCKILWLSETKVSEYEEDSDPSNKYEEIDYAKTVSFDSEDTVTRTDNITSLNDGYGMINDVYFSYNVVAGERRPQLGEKVHFVAERQHNDGGWIAKQVFIVGNEEWDDEHLKSVANGTIGYQKDKSILGQITEINKHFGKINEFIEFELSELETGFIAVKGDWVVADLVNKRGTHVKPLRIKTIEGEVTSYKDGVGYIDREIFFTKDVCSQNRILQKGQKVTVKAIESTQGNCNWRAIDLIVNLERIFSNGFNYKHGSLPPTSKNGVAIAVPLHFGKVTPGDKKYITAWVKNSGKFKQVLLACGFENSSQPYFSLDFPRIHHPHFRQPHNMKEALPLVLYPNLQLFVNIQCNSSCIGFTKELLLFHFERFVIGCYISIEIFDPEEDILKPTSEYKKCPKFLKTFSMVDPEATEWIIPGDRPTKFHWSGAIPYHLPQYPISKDLLSCAMKEQDLFSVAPSLEKELDLDCYVEKFTALMHLEEIQMNIDIRAYDMEQVLLQPRGEFLALDVPGLAEGRPSLLIGDKVVIYDPGQTSVKYEGYIHEVLGEKILLKFHSDVHENFHGEEYNVVFSFNRGHLRRMHQAIGFIQPFGEHILFPSAIKKKVPMVHPDVVSSLMIGITNGEEMSEKHTRANWFNKSLNERQKLMVLRVLQNCARPTPYVLFGPPGTGKTVTLVETILQVLHHLPFSRILACTPSNSAADLITERLHESGSIKEIDMLRLNAFQRSEDAIPISIKRYCNSENNLRLLARHRLIICTCSTSGMLYTLGLKLGHFTHVFVDEAGQATEPECMIPLGLVAGTNATIVLAGDHLQLGPIIRSRFAKNYGLQLSFLERLMNRSLYVRNDQQYKEYGGYNPIVVTKLLDNYRSHPDILFAFSSIFYQEELSCCNQNTAPFLSHCNFLPNKMFPVMFHGVQGKDMREGSSPSWFNPAEVIQIVRYLRFLYNEELSLKASDVGIITPYRKQVEKIRLLINSVNLDMPKVGSIEEFQGQERKVIILSTVRSTDSFLNFDHKFNLGFLSNPKRFNVAISRAQGLLIVLGNPHILAKDYYWHVFLKYCIKNKSYTGCDYPRILMEDSEDALMPNLNEIANITFENKFSFVKENKYICENGMEQIELENTPKAISVQTAAFCSTDAQTISENKDSPYDQLPSYNSHMMNGESEHYFFNDKIYDDEDDVIIETDSESD